MGLFLLLIVVVFFAFGKITHFVKPFFVGKKERTALHRFYSERFSYYNLLNKDEKRKFLIRVMNIYQCNELRIEVGVKTTKTEVEFLICAAFTQITFGYNDFEIERFTKIVVYPKTFHSKLANHEVKGLTLGNGCIFYSWEDFLNGYRSGGDKINLALHELAHALYIDRFHETENEDFELRKVKAHAELMSLEDTNHPSFFRAYGLQNINEFWAINVECFFEDPINFKDQHPHLYNATSSVLQQDMVYLKNRKYQE
jgi:Mlc titration factor MtfA (ptsG expression regulator)